MMWFGFRRSGVVSAFVETGSFFEKNTPNSFNVGVGFITIKMGTRH
jgi:hypothetical protein